MKNDTETQSLPEGISPLPWKISPASPTRIISADTNLVADMTGLLDDEANAKFIVEAVNKYWQNDKILP